MSYWERLSALAFFGAILIISIVWAAQSTMDGIARDCQKQTYFVVNGKKFECMEWNK